MILVSINDTAFSESYNSRLEELEVFREKCDVWEIVAREAINNGDANTSAVFKKTDRSMIVKIIEGVSGGFRTENTIVVTMVDDAGLIDKEWLWTDKIVQNSQGGTTHLIGWNLL